jgi:hypothetical protein
VLLESDSKLSNRVSSAELISVTDFLSVRQTTRPSAAQLRRLCCEQGLPWPCSCRRAPMSPGAPATCVGFVCGMDRAMLEDHLAAAERHIEEAERHILCQRGLVAQMEREGHDITVANRLLRRFEEMLCMHIADRERLRKELGL